MRMYQDAQPSTSQQQQEPWKTAPRIPKTTDGRGTALGPALQHFGYERIPAPWATKRYDLSIQGLHEEILDVFYWLKPSQLETSIRYRVFNKVAEEIRQTWPGHNVRVSVFGSLRTHLFLPTSDIDVLVECDDWTDSDDVVRDKTAKSLLERGVAKSVNVFAGAFVPIVKVTDNDTSLSIDISFNTVQGVKAADYIEKVKAEFPVVEPLVLILKQFIIQRGLNQTYSGGLSSYGLILMIINFLQLYALPVRDKQVYQEGVNLGELLMRFFEVYSQEFNYNKVGICVSEMRYKPKQLNKDGEPTSILSLEDPLLSTNEVGRSSFNYPLIRSAFQQALQILKAVFVRDRRRSDVFGQIYNGTLLSQIMPFTVEQINYRNWLKVSSEGFSLFYYPSLPDDTFTKVMNTALAPKIDLSKYAWHEFVTVQKQLKTLPITAPPADDEEENKKKPTQKRNGNDKASSLPETTRAPRDAVRQVKQKPKEQRNREEPLAPIIVKEESESTTTMTANSPVSEGVLTPSSEGSPESALTTPTEKAPESVPLLSTPESSERSDAPKKITKAQESTDEGFDDKESDDLPASTPELATTPSPPNENKTPTPPLASYPPSAPPSINTEHKKPTFAHVVRPKRAVAAQPLANSQNNRAGNVQLQQNGLGVPQPLMNVNLQQPQHQQPRQRIRSPRQWGPPKHLGEERREQQQHHQQNQPPPPRNNNQPPNQMMRRHDERGRAPPFPVANNNRPNGNNRGPPPRRSNNNNNNNGAAAKAMSDGARTASDGESSGRDSVRTADDFQVISRKNRHFRN